MKTRNAISGTLLLAASIAILAGCSIYYPPEKWARQYDASLPPTENNRGFRPDLMDCVTQFDPNNLDEFDNGGEYRLTGWFMSDRRFNLVRGCMVRKGWQPNP